MRTNIEKDLGFVIRRYNFRETSLIATLYTSRFGKIRGIFKGFYAQKKEFSSGLDIFSLNEFIFYPKRSEIWLISHADLICDYPVLKINLTKAKAAATIFNLIDRTMQVWDSNPYIFDLIRKALDLLGEESESKVLYIFLIKFLTFSGFKPEFNHCINCQDLLGEEVFFSASRGGLICRKCQAKINDIKTITRETSCSLLYIQNTDFPSVCRLNPSAKCEEEIFYILGEFLAFHFDFYDLLNVPPALSARRDPPACVSSAGSRRGRDAERSVGGTDLRR
jgi:DNA repair protein RecO (recombination protein O)